MPDTPTRQRNSDDASVVARVRSSFAKQGLMQTLAAELEHVGKGTAVIGIPIRSSITQQHGYVHAAAVAAIADSACGYAALTTMPADSEVVTIEFKLNLLAPAVGEWLRAEGEVIRAGRRITVSTAEVFAIRNEEKKLVALMQATFLPAPV